MSDDPAIIHRRRVRKARRRRRIKPDAEIVLLCNPRAGGRWRELARILDSEEARYTRRIVTDSVEDVAAALAGLGGDTQLLCVYGGDGTIQRVLDRLTAEELSSVRLALLGGGTMNVTSRWLGFSKKPANNFRHVVRAYRTNSLLTRDIPVLEVERGDDFYRCFTFGMGSPVRLLDAYERGRKGKVAALGVAARATAAALLGWPPSYHELLAPMRATVTLDDEILEYDDFAAIFANVTGQINPGVEPFAETRTPDTFYSAAYAVTAREFATALPMLIRGWLPVDLRETASRLLAGRGEWTLPTDARYVNRPASALVVDTEEALYTVDGEVIEGEGPVRVHVGPTLRLAAGPSLDEKVRLAAEAVVKD